MTSQWKSEIETYLWPEGLKRDVWMIVDGARDPRIVPMLRKSSVNHWCLYSGRLIRSLEIAAPYLVQLECATPGTRTLLEGAWGRQWGVFLKATSDANALRRHLREFLVVRDSGGRQLMFRYYDPRVLRVFLPTCTPDELRKFMGPIERWWVESEDSGLLVEYSSGKMGLIERRFGLNRFET